MVQHPRASRLIDIAPTGRATQSSFSTDSVAAGAQDLVSGDFSSDYTIHTEADPVPWWELDLGSWHSVQEIVIRNRKSPEFRSRAKTLRIEVSEDHEQWTTLHAGVAFFGSDDQTSLRTQIAGNLPVRYIRLSLDEPAPLHLNRVEVLVSDEDLRARRLMESIGIDFSHVTRYSHGGVSRETYRVVGLGNSNASAPSGLRVIRTGRFANNVIQMAQAIEVAKKHDLGYVQMLQSEFFDFERDVQADGPRLLAFSASLPPGSITVEGDFFYRSRISSVIGQSSPFDPSLVAVTRSMLAPFLSLPTLDAPVSTDELLIHVRSGDLFGDSPHPKYGQPPLAFYIAAIDRARGLGYLRVRVIAEDRLSPVINALEEYLNAQGIPHSMQIGESLATDLATLLSGRALVFGRGTFGVAICMLSERATVVFDGSGQRAYRQTFSDLELLCSADFSNAPYGPFHNWDGSPKQRAEMLGYPRGAVTLTEARPSE